MNTVLQSRQRGFAIADALIAFGVMVIAGVALLSLQGTLMNSSSLSKARAEAMVIARDHMELWRNYVEEAQYLAGPSPSKPINPTKVQGVNAEFMVSYNNNQPLSFSADKAESLTVSVCWECDVDADGVLTADDEKSVSLETMLYYTKPEIASAIGDQHDSSDSSDVRLPSPWITGVEGPHDSTKPIKEADLDEVEVPVTDSLDLIVSINESTGEITTQPHNIEIFTYHDPVTGHSNVEVVHGTKFILVDGALTEVPDVKLTSFGGIVHRLKGEIILHHDADTKLATIIENFKLLASPPSYCVAPICANGTCKVPFCTSDTDTSFCEKPRAGEEAQYVSYVCYVPGDCTDGDPDNVGCPSPFNPPTDKDLNGGWYGRIGNFNLFLDRERDMVCTADTEIGGSTPRMTPSREYATHRWELDVDGTTQLIAGNEGVNRSFDCDPDPIDNPTGDGFGQVFIIAGTKNGPGECLAVSADYPNLVLPSENIIRVVGDSSAIPNTLDDPVNSQYPYAYPIPYPPLTDLVRPITESNVVLSNFNANCASAP